MAGLSGIGDAVMLWDLGWRIWGFIDDVRHAQDDFIMLRNEAHCLLICINSLKSESTLRALKTLNDKQRIEDLNQIIAMTAWNMKDLNDFIGECKGIVKDHAKKKGWLNHFVDWSARSWAKLKWTWTDKQPFRDRLVLPAQSINIYLTSLTHVGLAQMPLLLAKSGSKGLIAWNDRDQKDARVHDWANVGFNVAFRERFGVKGAVMTSMIEDEVVLYVLHLLKGGQPFYKLSAGTTGHKHKVQKTTVSKKPGSRSRSRGPLAMGRGDDTAKMYVMRKKSKAGRASSEKVEIVEREWESDSDSGGRRPMLALPAPDGDGAESIIEIKPRRSRSSDDDDSDEHRGSGGRNRSRTRRSRSDHIGRRVPPNTRTEAAYDSDDTLFMPSERELEAMRARVLRDIHEEQLRANEEMQHEASQTVLGRPVTAATQEEARENAQIIGTVAYMETTYGISIAIVDREPIDAGPPPVEEPDSRRYADGGVHMMAEHEEMRKKKESRARQTSSLKAETYMATEAETPGPMRSYSRMYSSRYEPYDRSRIRTKKEPSKTYYEELGAVSPPPPGPYADPYFDVPYGATETQYGDDGRHQPRNRYPRRHPSDDLGGVGYEGHARSLSRSPRRRPSDSRKAHVEIMSELSEDEYRSRKLPKDQVIEKRHRDRRRREAPRSGPTLRDELRPSPGHMYVADEGERLRRAASYEGPESYRSDVEIRKIHQRDDYMTGARHSDDSDDSDGAALAVPRPRR